MRLELNGAWRFQKLGSDAWMEATVPGCNYLDLLHLGKIPDPFVGVNEKEVYWVAEQDWEYEKTFSVSEEMLACDRVYIDCKSLDTICDVFVNGACIGHGENAHLRYRFDVKPHIQIGENVLRIVFYSPVEYVLKKQAIEKCPHNSNGMDGIPHIRKPQCHFGWDWGPVLPPSGVAGDIALVGRTDAEFSDVRINQQHENGTVTLTICAAVQRFSENALTSLVQVLSPQGESLFESRAPLRADGEILHTVTIHDPQLWWTRDLSDCAEQPLYTVQLSLLSGDEIVHTAARKIGFRTIELDRSRDQYGENFQFKINGVPLFIKGANWIPTDSFVQRHTDAQLEADLDAAKFSNMNMLRIWGGGYYESDALYDKCDRDGILLWQDFCFACQPYPFFEEDFLENVKREVEYNVKRLRHHACLAIWSGNNEIEAMSGIWRGRLKYVSWTEKFFYHILPEWMQNLDDVTPYIPGTPCGIDHLKGYDRDNVGDTHLWAVWHGLQPLNYYRKRMTRFCSEFGFESLPDQKTIARYAKPEDYALTSEVFTAHQKCSGGNLKMAYYIATRFRLPKHFTDYIYLSQICQQECVRDATEHWRRNRGRCNGSMYWQFNDCWPVCSWSGMDYYGNYKALQYAARHFNAPVLLSLEDTKDEVRVFAVNDTTQPLADCRVRYALLDFSGKTLCDGSLSAGTLQPLQSRLVEILHTANLKKYGDLKSCVLSVELWQGERALCRQTLLFAPEKALTLPKTDVQVDVQVENGVAQYTLRAKTYVRFLQLYTKTNTAPFSDNYFDLLPGETRVVTQAVGAGVSDEEAKRELTIFSLADVVPKGSRVTDFLTRTKILLHPVRLGAYLINRQIPPDCKLD